MNISTIIDIALVVLTIILVIRYTAKGAVKSIFSFVKTFLAIGIAYFTRNQVAQLLDGLFMNNAITGWVYNSLYASARGTGDSGIDFVQIYKDTPVFFTNILTKFGIDLTGFDEMISALPYATDEQLSELAANIGSSISLLLSMIIGMVVVFILAIIVLTLIVNLLDKLTKLPVLNFVNRLLGAVVGLLISLTVIWAVNGIFTLLITYVGPMAPETLNQSIIDNSVILRLLKETNLVEMIKSYIE